MRKIAVRTIAGVVLLVAAALAVAGCGGGSKSSAPQPVTVTVAPTTPTTTTTEGTTTTPPTTSATSGLSGDCLQLAKQGQRLSQALGGLSAGSAHADLGKAADAYKAFAAQAPAEIRSEFQTIAAAFAKFADAMKGIHLKTGQTPDASTLAKLQEASKSFSAADVLAAEHKIAAWATSHCHA